MDFRIEKNGVGLFVLQYHGEPPATLQEALALSIRKWQILSILPVLCGDEATCGLCLFIDASNVFCHGCPVNADGHWGCMDTPYEAYSDAYYCGDVAARPIALQEAAYLARLAHICPECGSKQVHIADDDGWGSCSNCGVEFDLAHPNNIEDIRRQLLGLKPLHTVLGGAA
jgi:hypothetical protein